MRNSGRLHRRAGDQEAGTSDAFTPQVLFPLDVLRGERAAEVAQLGPGSEVAMAHEELQTYLSDHLAGSVAAVKILERLVAGAEAADDRRFFAGLQREIEEDRAVLAHVLEHYGGHPSTLRQAGAWATELLTEAKLRLDDPSGHRLSYFEALEGLALGILGKRALWRVLGAVAGQIPELVGSDFDRLAARAQDQHDRVDARRIAAGRRIFHRKSTDPDETS